MPQRALSSAASFGIAASKVRGGRYDDDAGLARASRTGYRITAARGVTSRIVLRRPRLAARAGILHIDGHESLASAGRRLAAHSRPRADQHGQDPSGGGADAGPRLGHDRPAAEAARARDLRSD